MKLSSSLPIALFLILAGCSKPSPEETFKKAEDAMKAGNYPLALETFAAVITDHPGSVLAEQAAFRIAATQHNEMHDYQAAVSAYQRYVDMYPDGQKTPTALFLTGFLYNNELHKLDSAALAYRRFLEKYPRHEMALSAQFELDNLGKSPDELLPEPPVTEEPTSKAPAKKGIGKNKKG